MAKIKKAIALVLAGSAVSIILPAVHNWMWSGSNPSRHSNSAGCIRR